MPFKEIATAALERGFSIIPLVPKAKDPLPGWGPTRKMRAMNDLMKAVPEDCNVGIVADENFLILETDDESQLRQLVRNCTGRELPITLTSQARFGRPHFFYHQTPRSLEVGNCTVAGLFELRSKNQYVVGPGSVHPTGSVYSITADYEIVPIPGWLVDCLLYLKGAAATVPAGQRVEVPLSGKVGEGEGRHYLLTSWAGRLWDGHKTEEELYAEVWAINEQSCDPPRSAAHVRDIVRWVISNGTPHDPGPKVTFGSTEVWGKTSTELLNRELPAREVLLKQGETPVLYEASLNQIFATRGLGKTNLALGLAGAIATGRDCLKFSPSKASNVLYVDGEMPLVQLQERIGLFVGDVPSFRYVNAEDLPGCRIPSLSEKDGKGQQSIIAAVEAHEIKVIIFDSLATLFRFETNDERSWINLEDFFKLLRQKYRLCVITLHHAGKAGLQRGHSRGDDLLDVSIKLEKFPDWEPGDGLKFQLKYEKVRHGGYLESFDAALTDGKWEVNPISASIEEVKELLEKGKGRIAIAKATGISEYRIRKLEAEMKAEGLTKLNTKTKEKK